MEQLSVYNFTDYREYLREFYKAQKSADPSFSYRNFIKKIGINAVGFYKDVVEGRRNLGRTLLVKFSSAIGHSKREAEYFEAMVYFCEARTVEERELYFKRMMEYSDSKAITVDATRYEFYSKWYYSAIRSVLSYYPFTGDYNELARMLHPSIRPEQAKKSILLLVKLGFIAQNSSGIYCLTEQLITTGVNSQEKALKELELLKFHNELIDMGKSAYDNFPTSKIDLSNLTVSISDETYQTIKKEIGALRKKILSFAEQEKNADRVYQINYQLFPLTKIEKDSK